MINACWFCFKWGLVLCAIGVLAGVYFFYHRADEEIRRRVESRIAQHYPGLKVTVRSATLVEEGIKVRGLSILEPTAQGPRAELLDADEVLLGCRAELKDLINGEPQITHVTLRRFTLHVTRRPDGTWSVAKLWPLPQTGKRPLEVRIEGGTLEIFDPLRNPSSTLTLRDINLTLRPPEAAAPATVSPDVRKLDGVLSGDFLQQVKFSGEVDLKRQAWTASGAVAGLDVSPELHAALPESLAVKLAALRGLRGQAELSFRVGYDPAAPSPYQYAVSGRLTRGRLDDRRLPHPLTDLLVAFTLDSAGVKIDHLEAFSNQARLEMWYQQAGFEENSPRTLGAKVRQLEIDGRLVGCLPASLQEQWQKYRPTGLVDADVKLSFDGQKWCPDISARCCSVSFTHYKFPYRLDDGQGELSFKDDVLRLSMTAQSAGQPIRLSAEVQHPMSGPTGSLKAWGDKIPLDEKLLGALCDEHRLVVQSLNPRGTVDFDLHLWRDAPEERLHQHLVIKTGRASNCSVQFDKFPYPIHEICGTLEMIDGNWEVHNLRGHNKNGLITCKGRLEPTLQGKALTLELTGTDVPLDQELRDALRPNERQVWHSFRPRGIVNLRASVRYLPEQKQISVELDAWPQKDSALIEPVQFPYRMEKLEGALHYRDGHVTFQRLKAEHGPVKLVSDGYCDFFPDGSWHFRLENLSVDRMRLDRDLIHALPERLKKALVDLKPEAPVNLYGSFDLERGAGPQDPVQSRWDVQLQLHRGSIECGVKLENIHGNLRLAGGFDGRRFYSRGELDFDSLSSKDYQFTQVRGPLWIDDRQVLLGSWVARWENESRRRGAAGPAQQPRPLTASLFGGRLVGDGWIALGAERRWGLQATLAQADLARCAQEVMSCRQNVRGQMMAGLELRGTGASRTAMGGRGTIQLREADIYELPLMIALLKILSIRPPDQSAFSTADINFRVEGEYVYFDRIDFNGDAISLLGKGDMDFESAIRLTFNAVVGRGDKALPVLKELFTGASQQIMQIHVGGTLQNPETRKEAFPGVNQALQQLQSDLQNPGPQVQAPRPHAR